MLELQDVTKTYVHGRRVVHALCDVSLRIGAGEFVTLMGPSGSGKSTLLHLLGALDVPTGGRVLVRGRDLGRLSDRDRSVWRRDRLGFVFQFFNLLPTLTATENVALPLLLAGRRPRAARERAQALLERVGVPHRAEHLPEELSGGEMQRVAIARALVAEPDVVLCDEPTGNLDTAAGREILALLRSVPVPGRRTVVLVTHDSHAAGYGDRVVFLRDGRVEAEQKVQGPHAVVA
jgi:putative ABC transport system ATP-binding protein